ncbi:MAG TPA: GGDEF domain-containing protein, partial [Rhabdaerophilum sp.]|nr:GGDEF domain-containing protein [Rhabdaerophilum sp.]
NRTTLDFTALIDKAGGQVIAEAGDSDTAAQRKALIAELIESSRMRGVNQATLGIGREARIVHDGNSILSLVAVPIGRNMVLVGAKAFTPIMLRRLSIVLSVPDLRVFKGLLLQDTSYVVQPLGSQSPLSLVWTPSRKAAETLADLAFFGLIASLAVAAIAILVFKRIRASTEAILVREAKASHEARHDPLSGLPNRAVFCELLADNIEDLPHRDSSIAVLLLDLDKFKDVNDTYGHAAGDKVIVDFGNRVRSLLRQTDVIARLGGDEFAVMQTGIHTHMETTRLAQAIIDA